MIKVMKFLTSVILLMSVNSLHAQTYVEAEDLPHAGDYNFDGEKVTLTLSDRGTHPMVEADFGDGKEYRFIVDTGASVNVLTESIANNLGFPIIGEMAIGAPGGKQVPGKIVKVENFSLEKGTVDNAEFVTMDIDGMTRGMAQGVISMALFRNYLLTYDLVDKQIHITREYLSPDDPEVMSYASGTDKIQVELDVAGTKVKSHLDTGSVGGIMLPHELMDELPLKSEPKVGLPARMVGGPRNSWTAQLDGVISFAGLKLVDPKIRFLSPSTGYGNIGTAVYGKAPMSIDQSNQLIAFRGSGQPMVKKVAPSRRVLGLTFKGMGPNAALAVDQIMPGSLAESAGFKEGDKLVSVNGRATADYSMPDLGKLMGGSDPLSIQIERDGELKIIEIE